MLLILCIQTMDAQEFWLARSPYPSISLEWIRPITQGYSDLTLFSGKYVLGIRVVPAPEYAFVIDVPFASFAGGNSDAGAVSKIGNPYLGIEPGTTDGLFYAQLGFRIPVSESESLEDVAAGSLGLYSDYDRLESFTENYLPLSVFVNAVPWLMNETVQAQFRFGAVYFAPQEDNEKATVLRSNIALRIFSGETELGVGYGGSVNVDEGGKFSGKYYDQFTFMVALHSSRLEPGFTLWIPVSDPYSDYIKLAFRFSCKVLLY